MPPIFVLFGVLLPIILIIAIISTWLKMGDLEAKQDAILKALARIETRLEPSPAPATITCIRCMGKAPADATACPHCGIQLRAE